MYFAPVARAKGTQRNAFDDWLSLLFFLAAVSKAFRGGVAKPYKTAAAAAAADFGGTCGQVFFVSFQ